MRNKRKPHGAESEKRQYCAERLSVYGKGGESMGLVKAEGLITRAVKYGEDSMILTIVTKELGLISAIAGRVRTAKSKVRAGTQLLVYGKFDMFHGREKSLYHINEAQPIQPFTGLRESLDKFAYAAYFCEIINKLIPENSPDEELLRLVLNTLYLLAEDRVPPPTLKTVLEFRAAAQAGYAPDTTQCSACGATENLTWFHLREGSVLCADCGGMPKSMARVTDAVCRAIAYICTEEQRKIFSFQMSRQATEYLGKLSEAYLRAHIETNFQTLDYLKNIIALG